MEAISRLAEQQTMPTAGGKLDAELEALGQQIEGLDRAKEALANRGDLESEAARQQLQEELERKRAEQAALSSPQMRAMTQTLDDRAILMRRAGLEADVAGVGHTEAEKLLRERSALQAALQRIRGSDTAGSAGTGDLVRAKEYEIRLWQTQEQIQTRILELRRQERQIAIDAQREFQRNLLLAGPGQQLQMLFAGQQMHRLRQGRLGSGEFNALSPELKRIIYEGMGGQAGALNREEQALLRGQQSVPESNCVASAVSKARSAVDMKPSSESVATSCVWSPSAAVFGSVPNIT
jgi:hypothetical protein